jgi:hypothetical protein
MIILAKSQLAQSQVSGSARTLLCATVLPAAICTMGTALLLLALGPCIALLMKAHDAQHDLPLKLAVGAAIALVVLIQVGSCGAGGFLVGRTQRRGSLITKDGRDKARGCLIWALGIFFGVIASLVAGPLLPASETKTARITSEQAVSPWAGQQHSQLYYSSGVRREAGHVVLASVSDIGCLTCSQTDESAGWLGQYLPAALVQPATAVAEGRIASDRPVDSGSTFSATMAASLIAGFSLSLSCLAACFCTASGGRRKIPACYA